MKDKKMKDKKLFFFFAPTMKNIRDDNINKTYQWKNGDEVGSGFIHYTSATAYAVYVQENKENNTLEFLGAYDDNEAMQKINRDIKDKTHKEPKWGEYNNEMSSEDMLKSIFSSVTLSEYNKIIIAVNGGIRCNVMFFSVISQIMTYREIEVELLYLGQKDSKEIIEDVSKQNKYFDVLRAVELFTETGNPKKLRECYNDKEALEQLFKEMENFYKSIQVCRPVTSNKKGIQNSPSITNVYCSMMNEIEKLISSNDEKIPVLMKFLLPEIKNRFSAYGKFKNKYFLQIVNWCYENDMITIAFFILGAEVVNYIEQLYHVNLQSAEALVREISDSDKLENIENEDDEIVNNKIEESAKEVFQNHKMSFSDGVFKSVLITQLIRRIRNSLAHSDKFTGILGEDKYYSLTYLVNDYNNKSKGIKLYSEKDKIISFKNKNKKLKASSKEIVIIGQDAYDKYRALLKCILDDLEKISSQKENA